MCRPSGRTLARFRIAILAAALPLILGPAGPVAAQPAAAPETNPYPKSIPVPGTDTFVIIGGYVKLDMIHDLDPIGSAYNFKVNSIPVEGSADAESGGRTTIHARESRLNVDVRSHSDGREVRGFVEGDFYGDGNAFRLRHAYGEWGHLLGGQTWTTFMDLSARPTTIDFEGTDGEVFLRQAQLRWTQPVAESWKWAVALENPAPELTLGAGADGAARSSLPDLTTNLRYESGESHVQLSGLLRQVRYEGGADETDASEAGWGISGSFKFRIAGPLELMGQVYTGEGIGHYVSALEGQSSDGLVDDSNLTTLPASGLVFGLTQNWTKQLRSGLAYSRVSVDNDSRQAGSALHETQDVRGNLIWTPARRVDLGLELLWGRVEHHDRASGEALRFQMATIFHLN